MEGDQYVFLLPDDWSPRYDTHFYTCQLIGHDRYTNHNLPPPSSSSSSAGAATAATTTTTTTTTTSTTTINTSSPTIQNNHEMGGNTRLPAYYYHLIVRRGRVTRYVCRRYSQFYWLYRQILHHHPPPSISAATTTVSTTSPQATTTTTATTTKITSIQFPPGILLFHSCRWQTSSSLLSCFPLFHSSYVVDRNEIIIQQRQQQLSEFLHQVLQQPQYASHPAVVVFLELDGIQE
jgi:hypothetical protein